MWFDYSRDEGFPTQFARNHTPVTVDVLDAGFIVASVILAISFFISIISTRTDKNVYLYIRVTISIIVGVMIMLGNFGQEWEVGEIKTHTHYKAGSGSEIYAKVGLKIGLRSVNVTLKSLQNLSPDLQNEKIDYNERFHWTWDQGRFGFGPYAGELQREFREAQYRGAPLPILWIVDYFVIDGEGFRHGRFYRTAGWYSHIAMWSAFPCWLVANILFKSVIRYGGYMIGIAGILQLVANLLWVVIRNPNPLVIPFSDATIYTYFGPSYWLTFSSGIICLTISIAIIICEMFFHSQLHIFFGLDPIINTDTVYNSPEEDNLMQEEVQMRENTNDIEMRPKSNQPSSRLSYNRRSVIRVRRNTNKAIVKMEQNAHSGPVYENFEKSKPIVENDEEAVEYDSVTQSTSHANPNEEMYDKVALLQPKAKRALPPLPKRRI